MSDERYKILANCNQPAWVLGSPVLVQAYNLLSDQITQQTILQIKFKNIGKQTIIALYIDIVSYDIEGKLIAIKEDAAYLDLKCLSNAEFGTNIPQILPKKDTRGVEIVLKKVVFSDKTTWDNIGKVKLDKLSEQIPLSNVIGKELSNIYTQISRVKYKTEVLQPIDVGSYWMCSCGEFNSGEECCNCSKSKSWIFTMTKEEALKSEKERRDKEAQEKAIHEEEIRKAKEAEIQEFKKKFTKIIKRVSIVVVTVIVALIIYNNVAFPVMQYYKATKLYEEGSYEKSYKLFKSLGTYKNAEEMSEQVQYDNATKCYSIGDYKESYKLFKSLGTLNLDVSFDNYDIAYTLDSRKSGLALVDLKIYDGEVLGKQEKNYCLWIENGAGTLSYSVDDMLINPKIDIKLKGFIPFTKME